MYIRRRFNVLLNRYMRPADDDASTGGGGSSDDASDDGSSSQLSGADVVGTGNAARLAMLDRINDQNDRERADELADVNDDDTTTAFVAPVDPDAEADLEVDPDADAVDAAADDDDLNGGDVVDPPVITPAPPPKIKVNGVEVDLTPELIAKAQKIASADKYLEEARTAAPPPPAPAPKVPSPEDLEAARRSADDKDLALVRAIQVGTEEEAMRAIREIRSQQPQGLTPDEVGRITDERLQFSTALNWFEDEYKDLVSDPRLHNMVLQEDTKLVREGDKRPYKERYKAIGDEIREWAKGKVAAAAPPPPAPAPPSVDKNKRKAAAPAPVVQASTRAKVPNGDDEPDESPSAVIAKMAQSRGGSQAFR